ncbi:MAG: right-handed parallel beta-helix repeat-containing protein, partial [Promethearchaeota archaeon]
ITKNKAIGNTDSGIYLYSGSENNNITKNTAVGNYRHGIRLSTNSKWNNITRNTINGNTITGIYLEFTSNNNIIKNNTINRNDLGILLSSSNFNNVSDNNIKDNNWCIFETGCTGNIIINNDCTTSTIHETIFIDGAATGVGAHNWTWAESQIWCSGSGTEEVPYVIENLKISGFGFMKGIEIRNSDVYFTIQNCEIYNSYTAGIYFNNVTNSQLIENNCSNNFGDGIHLYEECSYNDITENIANYNDNSGISIGDKCDNNTISRNTASYNDYAGVNILGGGFDSCYNNTICGNNVINNTYGIRLDEACHFTKISENIINGNNFGIYLYSMDSNLNHNYIIENIISSNKLGIYLGSESSNNSVYKNFFLENGKHAYDDGTDNKWNSTTIGNYWDNHTGPDANNDGIVDIPYTYIGGTAGSIDYLPIAEKLAPEGLDPGVIAIIVIVSIIGGLTITGVILRILEKKGKISLEKLRKLSFKKK